MASVEPGYEVRRRIIEVIGGDSIVHSLLFPNWAQPQINANDTRVYNAHANLRDEQLLQVLPRVLVEVRLDSNNWEQQEDVTNSAPVTVWIHCIVPRDQDGTAELLDSRIRTLFSSTYLTNSRIIMSELVQTGQRYQLPEREFNDAWRYSSQYHAVNAGVLV